jgi:hypothetical protein
VGGVLGGFTRPISDPIKFKLIYKLRNHMEKLQHEARAAGNKDLADKIYNLYQPLIQRLIDQ